MLLINDSKEFIALLNSRGVEYLIVGAHSLAFHARPRFTGDLDILLHPSPENAAKIVAVLNEFGFADLGVKPSDFTTPKQVIQLGRAPHRIDLLTSISGVSIDEAFATKVSAELDEIPVASLSKRLLIANKRAVGRPRDLADLTELDESC
ncbi:MAG: nucleotidyltransferase [Chthoniobacterales bacterium]